MPLRHTLAGSTLNIIDFKLIYKMSTNDLVELTFENFVHVTISTIPVNYSI